MDKSPAARPGELTGGPDMIREPVGTATLEMVVPVFNKEHALPGFIRTLHAFLEDSFPLSWRITILDRGSTDETWDLARNLTEKLPGVHAKRLEKRGRGAALKAAWRDSPADIVGSLDVDLPIGAPDLWSLVSPLVAGHCAMVVGRRPPSPSPSWFRRQARREFLSREYNRLLRLGFGVRVNDAQCEFKAARGDVIRPLLGKVENDNWFFDTELLLLAECNGFRVHEVSLEAVAGRDSSDLLPHRTWAALKGLIRVTRAISGGRAAVEPPTAQAPWLVPSALLTPPLSSRLIKLLSFGIVGVLSSGLYVLLYIPFRGLLPPALANLSALILSGFFNTEAHRRWTFQHEGVRRVGMHLRAAVIFATTYAFTTVAVLLLRVLDPGARPVTEALFLDLAYVLMTVLRYIALDRWVFRRRGN